LRSDFNLDKAEKLKVNKENGSAKAAEKLNLESELETLESKIQELHKACIDKQSEIDALVKPTAEHTPTPEMIALKSEIDAIVIPEIVKEDTTALESKKIVISEELDALKAKLSTREQAKQIDARIEELTQQKRVLSQQIADLEKLEFQIETYQNSEMDLIEKRVNDKFSIVKFKMFEKQMNGGVKQTCVAMVDGVPYKSVNTAGQIQASLDIINAMQHHYQTFATAFIDNAESITDIPVMQCQTVQLIVDKNFKKLEVFTLD
jgi:DNA repair protein SbcC/Rad50